MKKGHNRREFLQKLGALSLAAGAGSALPLTPFGQQARAESLAYGMQSGTRLKIHNGRIITPFRIIDSGTVVVTDGKITEVREGNIDVPGAVEIDAGGQYIAPGFVDLHVHGGGDHDFLDGSVEAFLGIAEAHAQHGTTSMYPTATSGNRDQLMRNLELYESADEQNNSGAEFLGMFLEGPYYSMDQRGAQDPRYVRDPDPEEYREILSSTSVIKRWDSAPEREGALEFAEYLISQGVKPSMGHTSAVYEDVIVAFEHGYTLATHLYSGMLGVTRRDAFRYAGAVESAYLIEEMNVEVIADNRHLPPPLLKLIYKIKGPDSIALVTDAMRGAGMPDGPSILGNREDGLDVIIEDGVAKLPDRTSFAGSVATTDRLVRVMINEADVPLTDAVRMMSATPASIMGVDDRKGSLVKGKDADIVIFNDDIEIDTTIVNGRVIYNG
ncbi:MAG: N-acetylglucosamine-6-phosphate deacetylase [Balneolaceae bacterium]